MMSQNRPTNYDELASDEWILLIAFIPRASLRGTPALTDLDSHRRSCPQGLQVAQLFRAFVGIWAVLPRPPS